LLLSPDFTNWDDEFVNKDIVGPYSENKELKGSLKKMMQVQNEQFDEGWKKALVKIVWVRN